MAVTNIPSLLSVTASLPWYIISSCLYIFSLYILSIILLFLSLHGMHISFVHIIIFIAIPISMQTEYGTSDIAFPDVVMFQVLKPEWRVSISIYSVDNSQHIFGPLLFRDVDGLFAAD